MMARQLAAILCVGSLLLFQSGGAASAGVPLLTPVQLEDPALVSTWLQQHASSADVQRAAAAYDDGLAERRRKRWGPALKAFGLSALLLPTPQALNAYADALLRFSGSLRAHHRNRREYQDRDLKSFESLSRAALASDAVLSSMSEQERQRTVANVACVAAWRRHKAARLNCAPLHIYGLGSQ